VSGWLIVYAAQQPPMLYLMVAIVGVRFFGISRSVLRYCERLSTHDVVLRWASSLRVRLWDGLESLENLYDVECVSSPSGVTHLILTRC
jgi:ATP-binding cassette subfamily C protein CydCD